MKLWRLQLAVLFIGWAAIVVWAMRWCGGVGAFVREILTGTTQYSYGYSEGAFLRIRPGGTLSEVRQLLGPALKEWTNEDATIVWKFSDGIVQTAGWPNCDYTVRTVVFSNGAVVRVVAEFYAD